MDTIRINNYTNIEISEEENKVKIVNTSEFKLLVIKPNQIKDRDWNDPNYLHYLVNDKFCQYLTVKPDEYIDFIGKHLNVSDYKEPYIKVELIFEEKDYITEMMYIEVNKDDEDKYILNEFGNLLHIGQDKIFGSIIINRSYVSSTNNDMQLDDITPDKLEHSLYKRAHTTTILYDSDNESYREVDVFGPMDVFAEQFFGEKKYNIKKNEFVFLKHNIFVWYTEDSLGIENVCGTLIKPNIKVDKMIVFSMWTEDYRDSLYLEEFNKIIFLSKKLLDFQTPPELLVEEKDSLGRDIVKNKYKILNLMYQKYIS